jgi:hypothetical protein
MKMRCTKPSLAMASDDLMADPISRDQIYLLQYLTVPAAINGDDLDRRAVLDVFNVIDAFIDCSARYSATTQLKRTEATQILNQKRTTYAYLIRS